MKFQVNDIVMYSGNFLRSICDFSKETADRRMKIERIVEINERITLCKMRDIRSGEPVSSLTGNLEHAKGVL